MLYGRGFGFRGRSPAWPFIGRGRGGLPRCWAYGANWGASYLNPYWQGGYAHPFPEDWDPYGTDDPTYAPFYPEYPQTMGPWERYDEPPMMTREEETEWLKAQAELIRQEIDQIKNRMSEIEKE